MSKSLLWVMFLLFLVGSVFAYPDTYCIVLSAGNVCFNTTSITGFTVDASQVLNPTWLNANDQRYNDTVLANSKALPGSCASGFVVQNTTTGGVQCVNLSSGPQGIPGVNGSDGVSVVSALVLLNGSLNVTLSNGSVFISGNLTGPSGPQGVPGVNGTNAYNITNNITTINNITNNITQNITTYVNTTYNITNNITQNFTTINNITQNITNNITNNISTVYNASGVLPYLFGQNNISLNTTAVLGLCAIFNDTAYIDGVAVNLSNLKALELADNSTQALAIAGLVSSNSSTNLRVDSVNSSLQSEIVARVGNDSLKYNASNPVGFINSSYGNSTYYFNSNPVNYQNDTQVNASITQALATTVYLPNSSLLFAGSLGGGNNIGNLSYIDGQYYNASNNFDIRVNFTNVSSFNDIAVKMSYSSNNAAHYVVIALWDYSSSSWQGYTAIPPDGVVYENYDISIDDPSNHLNSSLGNGTVQLRIYMGSSATASDVISIDRSVLLKGLNIPSSTATNPVVSFVSVGSGDVQGFNLTRFDGVSFVSYLDYGFKANQSQLDAVNTSGNVQSLGFLNSSQISSAFTNKSSNEVVVGNWLFNPSSNVSFGSGQTLFYNPVYFFNTVTLTNQSTMSVNGSVLLRNIGGSVIGNWSDNGAGSALLWNNGVVNSTGSFYTAGSFVDGGVDVLGQEVADNSTQASLISGLQSQVVGVVSNVSSLNSSLTSQIALELADNSTQASAISGKVSPSSSGVCAFGVANFSIGVSSSSVSCASQQGTVTSITASGPGLTGGTITSSGTIGLNTTYTDSRYLQSVPYQSSASGWTNTSTQTITALKVGIGTNAPNVLLTVNGTGSLLTVNGENGTLTIDNNGAGSGTITKLYFRDTGSGTAQITSSKSLSITDSGARTYLQTSALSNNNLYLNPNGGNVGIGTTVPSNTLSVIGTFNSTGNVYTSGSFIDSGIDVLAQELADNTTQASLISGLISSNTSTNSRIDSVNVTAVGALPKSGGVVTGFVNFTSNVSFGGGVLCSVSSGVPCYSLYINSTWWNCVNATGTIVNRGNSSLTCG